MPKALSHLDGAKVAQLLNFLAHVSAGAPATPAAGQFWYDSTDGTFNFKNATVNIKLGRLDQITAPTAAVAMNAQKITGLADPTTGTDAANRQYVLGLRISDFTAPNVALAMNAQKITGLADPTAAQDAATKAYVDGIAAGLDPKGSVRAATTAAGTLATSFANGQVIDGITLATGDRILIKDQAAAAENGIYTVNASGAPTRATDMDAWTEVPGAHTFVEVGTVNADTGWVATADQGGTLNTTAIPFTKFSAAATGMTRFTTLIGDGSTTSIVVTHSLGQQYPIAQVYEVSTLAQVSCDVVATSTTTMTFTFAVAPATNALRVVIAA